MANPSKGLSSNRRRALAAASLALPMVLLASATGANSVAVTDRAALEGNYGLEVTLDASRNSTEIWVAIGPEDGPNNEIAVQGSFLIDPEGLEASGSPRSGPDSPWPGHVCFLSLAQHLDDSSGAKVLLFLEPAPQGAWQIGALLWEDSVGTWRKAPMSPLVAVSIEIEGNFGRPDVPRRAPPPARLDFEWAAATAPGARDGYFRLFRTVDEQTALLFELTDLDNGSQTLNYMQVGLIAAGHRHRGIGGALHLDAFQLSQILSTN
jgi:hypothetical protein